MTTLNISMPESMRQYVEQQAEEGDFTASEYIRYLIRLDKKEKEDIHYAAFQKYLVYTNQQKASGKLAKRTFESFLKEADTEHKKRLAKHNVTS